LVDDARQKIKFCGQFLIESQTRKFALFHFPLIIFKKDSCNRGIPSTLFISTRAVSY
jgi:hypothetical protein